MTAYEVIDLLERRSRALIDRANRHRSQHGRGESESVRAKHRAQAREIQRCVEVLRRYAGGPVDEHDYAEMLRRLEAP